MKTILILLFWAVSTAILFSQTTLQGKVTDANTGEPIIFGTIALYRGDILITGTETDIKGYYKLTELDPGIYTVVFSYTGFIDTRVTWVVIREGKITKLDATISADQNHDFGGCIYEAPLISKDETTQGFKFDSDQISRTAH